jgi:hypothetical protein
MEVKGGEHAADAIALLPPSFSINDVTRNEGNSGTTPARGRPGLPASEQRRRLFRVSRQ